MLTVERFAVAARRVAALAGECASGLGERDSLCDVAGILYLEAAAGTIARGDSPSGSGGPLELRLGVAFVDPGERRLARSSALYLTGEHEAARRVLHERIDGSPQVIAEAAIQRAELSLHDAAKRQAEVDEARRRAAEADAPTLRAQAAWLGVAVGLAAAAEEAEPQVARWRERAVLPPAKRRAARFEAFRQRVAAPEALAAYFAVAAQLADEPAQIPVWLDALTSLETRRVPLRVYAFERARAAQWRGDTQAHDTWMARYRKLAGLLEDPALADLFQQLRL